jgi:BirA family biotin operon repressor/biotin-[acetyl-CoA-carboxylase] ligase
VYRFDEIDSTNTFARTIEPASDNRVIAVTAQVQLAGRGQRGNVFHSDNHDGMWLSLVVRPESIERHFAVNRALALAAADTCGPGASIKWPNDILLGGRKVGGILLESSEVAPGCIVAGIGINVNVEPEAFPTQIRAIATSLLAVHGARRCVEDILCGVIEGFERWRAVDEASAHERYRARLAGAGQPARIGECSGRFDGVGADGRAVLICGDEPRYFWSGPLRFEQ